MQDLKLVPVVALAPARMFQDMLRMIAILASALFASVGLAQAPDLISPKGLVGAWQVTPYLGSGWNDTYLFYPDGKVIFAYNQMDSFKRLQSREGTWTLEGTRLIVTYTKELVTVGGKVNKKAVDGDNGIEGGKDILRPLAKPIVLRFTLSAPKKPQKNRYGDGAWSLLFENKRFYKMKNDPKEFEA